MFEFLMVLLRVKPNRNQAFCKAIIQKRQISLQKEATDFAKLIFEQVN